MKFYLCSGHKHTYHLLCNLK